MTRTAMRVIDIGAIFVGLLFFIIGGRYYGINHGS